VGGLLSSRLVSTDHPAMEGGVTQSPTEKSLCSLDFQRRSLCQPLQNWAAQPKGALLRIRACFTFMGTKTSDLVAKVCVRACHTHINVNMCVCVCVMQWLKNRCLIQTTLIQI
jgi:hypothetical protein